MLGTEDTVDDTNGANEREAVVAKTAQLKENQMVLALTPPKPLETSASATLVLAAEDTVGDTDGANERDPDGARLKLKFPGASVVTKSTVSNEVTQELIGVSPLYRGRVSNIPPVLLKLCNKNNQVAQVSTGALKPRVLKA